MAAKIDNPFLVYGYEGPDYFCDREQETDSLISHLQNGWNVTLISPRRMGKTGLISQAFHRLTEQEPDSVCIYVDIFGTNDLHDFVQLLGTAMLNAVCSKGQKAMQKILQLFSSWRPVLGADPVSGVPQLSVTLEPTEAEFDLKKIFSYMKSSEKQIYLAIDEFQQITEYPETGVEAQLRSYIQFVHNAHFIFSGSKLHLMSQMFFSPKRPFFQSTWLLDLHTIGEDVYYDFANGFFAARGGHLSHEIFHTIYQLFDGHTWYVQSLLKVLYARYEVVSSTDQLTAAIEEILGSNDSYFSTIMSLLTPRQQAVTRAIAHEGMVKEVTAGSFIRSHRLTSASTVQSALKTLVAKEIIYHSAEGYQVYNRFFALWLRRH